jgi:hypothetical protein
VVRVRFKDRVRVRVSPIEFYTIRNEVCYLNDLLLGLGLGLLLSKSNSSLKILGIRIRVRVIVTNLVGFHDTTLHLVKE